MSSLNEEYFMVHNEKHRRTAMFNDHQLEGFVMVSNKVHGSWIKSLPGRDQPSPKQNKEGLWCSYYKKPRHTRETCFKLHVKEAVLNKMGGFKNLQSKNKKRLYLSTKESEEPTEKVDSTVTFDLGELNADEINKLKILLTDFSREIILFGSSRYVL